MREPSKHPARPISLSVGLIACGALLAPLPALALDNPTLGGIGAGDGDYLEYNSRPDSLVPCDSVTITPFCTFLNDGAYPPIVSLSDLLNNGANGSPPSGSPPPLGNAGGNVELFASSETMPLGVFETYTGVTTLFGELEGTPVSFSSLTWPDWQVESYDCASTPQTATLVPGGLLDRWLADLGTAYGIAPASPQALAELAGAMICGDFLQRFSDPNIAYVNDGDPGNGGAVPVIGLAGTDDLCSIMAPILTNAGITPPAPFPTWASFCAVPVGTPPTGRPAFQISELVKLEGGGLSTILYSFSAINSGQSELQSPTSHTGIYEITAPFIPPFIPPGPPTPVPAIQPFGLALLSFGLMLAAGWARRRRR